MSRAALKPQPLCRTFDHKLMRRGMRPRSLDVIKLPNSTSEALMDIATGVFISASNAGKTFQEALLAVYITGVENGSSAMKDDAPC